MSPPLEDKIYTFSSVLPTSQYHPSVAGVPSQCRRITLIKRYGCPSMEELECYNKKYKERLDEVGSLGEIPDDLALEVSTPGAERLLKVPDDIGRFKDMPMRVCYTENLESNCSEREGVFLLDFIEKDSEMCVWKLADVKENRDPLRKGRTLNRKQKD